MKVTTTVTVDLTNDVVHPAQNNFSELFSDSNPFPLADELKTFTSGERFTPEQKATLENDCEKIQAQRNDHDPEGAFQRAVKYWLEPENLRRLQTCLDNNRPVFLNGAVQSRKTVYYTALIYVITKHLEIKIDIPVLLTNNITASKKQQWDRARDGALHNRYLCDLAIADLQTYDPNQSLNLDTLLIGMASARQVEKLAGCLHRTIEQQKKFADAAGHSPEPLKVLLVIDESDLVEPGTAGPNAPQDIDSELDKAVYRLVQTSQQPWSGFELQTVHASATMVSSLYLYTRFWQCDLQPEQVFWTPVDNEYKGYRTPQSNYDPSRQRTGLLPGHKPGNIDFIVDRTILHSNDPVGNPYMLPRIATVSLSTGTKTHGVIARDLERSYRGRGITKVERLDYDFDKLSLQPDTEVVIVVQNGNTTNITTGPGEKIYQILDRCMPKIIVFVGGLMINRAVTFECKDWNDPNRSQLGGYADLAFIAPSEKTQIQNIMQMHRHFGVRPDWKDHWVYTTDHIANQIEAYHAQDLEMKHKLSQGPVSPGVLTDWYLKNKVGTHRVNKGHQITSTTRTDAHKEGINLTQRGLYVANGYNGFPVVEADWIHKLTVAEWQQIQVNGEPAARSIVEQRRNLVIDPKLTRFNPRDKGYPKGSVARLNSQAQGNTTNTDTITWWENNHGDRYIYHYRRIKNSWYVKYQIDIDNKGWILNPTRPQGTSQLYPPSTGSSTSGSLSGATPVAVYQH